MHTRSSAILYKTAVSGLLLAMALLLPFLTWQIPAVGNMLLPMHIPVLLCGFICGAPYGAAVGLLAPFMRSFMFATPILLPTAITMSVELLAYGLISGLLHAAFPKKIGYTYLSLIISMLAGRCAWGIASTAVYRLMGNTFSAAVFFGGAFAKAVPGIILQLILIPLLVRVSHKFIKFK